jgi:hypothetical protein
MSRDAFSLEGKAELSEISENVLQAAVAFAADDVKTVDQLNNFLKKFIAPNFDVGRSSIVDLDGKQTATFPIVVFRNANGESVLGQPIPIDRVAAVIDVYDELDQEGLREAYDRISSIKQIAKTPVPRGDVRSNVTMGIVFAKRSSCSLEAIADEVYHINSKTHHDHWLDMVVLPNVGVLNYAVQFPCDGLSGDFMPPAQGALRGTPPAFYVVMVMRPLESYSCNKFLSVLIAHLQLFAPDVREQLPNFASILDGVSPTAVTYLGFQPNLDGALVPATAEEYRGRNIPQSPITIEDAKGSVLANIEFRKWQDGGIVLLVGKLPLEGMLVFLPNPRSEYLRVIKRDNVQVSYVLPIDQPQFQMLLDNIRQRSNLKVNTNPGGFVIQKLMDEGTSTPFIARCTLGLLRIRENVITDPGKRDVFDKVFQNTLSSLMTARSACKEYHKIWTAHVDRIASGEIGRINGPHIEILENADKKLSVEFESFLNAATRAIKTGLQALSSQLGVDIGFLFKKPSAFEAGIAKLRDRDSVLADYLLECRKWTERLVLMRNNLEHEIWEFPKVKYALKNGAIQVEEPHLGNESVGGQLEFFLDRLQCAFEEMLAHLLQFKLPMGVALTEISAQIRTQEAPERFRVTLAVGGEEPWTLQYCPDKFDEV